MFKPFFKSDKFVVSVHEPANPLVYEEPKDKTLANFLYQIQATHWLTKEVDFTLDKATFDQLDSNTQITIGRVLAFFAMAEGAVIDNLEDNMADILQCGNIRYFIKSQLLSEHIHAETYSKQLKNLFPDTFEEIVKGLASSAPPIMAKNNWMRENFSVDRSILDRVLSSVFAEGILFQTSFAMISKLAAANVRMPGLIDANQYISRDESLHCHFFTFIFNEMKAACVDFGDYEKRARIIWSDAVEVEKKFIDFLFEHGPFFDLSRDDMVEYLEFVADGVWNLCDFDTKSKAKMSPLPHMETYMAPVLVNFFEQRPTGYVKGVVVNTSEVRDFMNL